MAPPLVLPVHYDFSSTICFVAHRVLERMDLDALGVVLDWRPIDLVAITGWRRGIVVQPPGSTASVRTIQRRNRFIRLQAEPVEGRVKK